MPFTLEIPMDGCAGLSKGVCDTPLHLFPKMNGIGATGYPGIPAITSISTSRPSSMPATATVLRAGMASAGKNFR